MTEWIVCPDCHGEGHHVLHGAAFTGEDLAELGPEFLDDMKAGVYDTQCDTCHGRTTIPADELDDYYEAVQDARTRWYESGCPA